MDGGEQNIFFVDWRNDENLSIEIDRAVYLRTYYGILVGVRYLLSRGVRVRTTFRVLIAGQRRTKKHIYLPLSDDNRPLVNIQRIH